MTDLVTDQRGWILLLPDSCSVPDMNELLVTVHIELASPYKVITTEYHKSAIYLDNSVHRPKMELRAEEQDLEAGQCVLPLHMTYFLF